MLVLSFVCWSVACLPETAVLKVYCVVLVPCVQALQFVPVAKSKCPGFSPAHFSALVTVLVTQRTGSQNYCPLG